VELVLTDGVELVLTDGVELVLTGEEVTDAVERVPTRRPLPCTTVKVTGSPSLPLQESFTQARSGSGRKPPVSAF